MRSKGISWLSIILFSLQLTKASLAQETPSHEPTLISLGSSTALEGPAKTIGQNMTLGAQIYLDKINALGGISGKKIKLITYNDSYEPSLTAPNIRKLILKDEVLAIINNVGAPNAVVAVPIVNELKTLLYGCYSGASILRKEPPDRYVFNFRASYREETAAMVKGLLKIGIKPEEIALFTQNDPFGDDGYNGAIKALKDEGYLKAEQLVRGRFTRNTLNVEEGLSEILNAKVPPKAIIIIAPYLPAAQFIKLAIKDLPNTLFLNTSFVGSINFAEELGSVGNKQVIVTQVVPDYLSDLPAVKEYRESFKQYAKGQQLGYISLEGYLATKLFVVALERAARAAKNQQLTREGIVEAMQQLKDVDIGIGIPISFDKNNHQALHQVWPTLLNKGRFVAFDWDKLRQK